MVSPGGRSGWAWDGWHRGVDLSGVGQAKLKMPIRWLSRSAKVDLKVGWRGQAVQLCRNERPGVRAISAVSEEGRLKIKSLR